MWFIGVEVAQETSAPPPKKNPGSAPERVGSCLSCTMRSTQVKEQIKKSIMSIMPQIASETFIDQ